MKLLDRDGLKPDPYVRSGEDWSAPEILVPLERLGEALAVRRHGQHVGVELPNSSPAAFLLPVQDSLDLVAVDFPKFSDGRGFSIGRALRDQGYKGTLRASGALIPDQFAFALDCGFDEVEISDEQAARQPEAQWLQALTTIGVTYLDRGSHGSIPERRRASA